ncbi:hypothetical protein [Microbispora sp. GKU 823]|uniref:hypothetical protein n=1 Tax=Microbispora sp. GKU 823 TaxID=1652100 RepID=UPI0009A3BBCD|nr:hypothetical protein [Microbispora sp. GKU 823]OPG10557.1 hypothetical protein B1L11_23130 [Microbispora sp. GKU 823]
MATFDDILAAAAPPTRTVPLCLAGDLQAQWEDLDRQRRDLAARPAGDTLAGAGGELRDVTQRMDAVREQMQAKTVVFRIQGLPKRRWSDLIAKHAPRPEDQAEGLDYHAETFPVAALAACCVDPELSEEQAARLVDEILTNGQWAALWRAILEANNRAVDIPKSVSA